MKFILSICIAMLFSIAAHAQNNLSGIVSDSDDKAVEFATAFLFPVGDSSLVEGVVTDENGSFLFPNIKTGHYQLTVQMLGYKDWKQLVIISDIDLHLSSISLIEEATLLGEIQVVAEQSIVESHLGKKVLRLGKDLSTTGSNALEALETIPSVTTTPRGNIQIRGNTNVVIYINGKATNRDPTTLKFIAAESLEKIEIITNPSAKYDAEGVGGIINLVYKKDTSTSFKLEFISNLSTPTNPFYLNPNTGLNISFTKKKISFFANVSYDYGKYQDHVDARRDNFKDSLQRYENLSVYNGLGNISNALVGFSIEPDSSTTLGLEINYDRWDIQNEIQQQNIFDYKFEADKSVNLPSERKELETELWTSVAFKKKFSKKKILSITFNAGGENETNFSKSDEINLSNVPSSVQQFLLSSNEKESQRYYQGRLAYEAPFFNWGTIETGMKADFIQYHIFQKIVLRSNIIQPPDNDFTMDMQKIGVYLLQKKQIKKLEYGLGLRLEQFSSKADQRVDQSTFTQNYLRLFPSVQFNYLLADHGQTLGFNYTRRINRPGFFDLNPYISYEDPLNLETGNPELQPEIADLMELNYHQEWTKVTMDLTFYTRKTREAIQSVVLPIDEDRSLSTSANIGIAKRNGMEAQLNYTPRKYFKATAGFVLAQNQFEDSENEISYNENTTWSLRLKQQWRFKEHWKLEISEIYRAPSYQIQQKTAENYYVNFALSKKFKNKRGSISFVVRDVFNTRQNIQFLRTSNFEIERSYKWQTRQIVLGLKYILFDKKK